MDVTDTFVEQVRSDPASPSGLSTVYKGRLEPVVAIDETFRVNPRTPGRQNALDVVPPGGAIPAQTLIVPRRNNGPLLTVDRAAGRALSVQYTGFSPTTELDAFRRINVARDVDDFREALQYFDLGAQNFTLRRPQGEHRLLHQRGGADPRGPAGRQGRREPAVPAARRHRRKRVAPGPEPAASPVGAVRDRAVPRDAADGQPAGRVRRVLEQRSHREHLRQRRPQPGPPRRRHLLPGLRPQRVPGRPHHRHGAGGRPQGPDHGGRRREHAGGHDHDRRSVLHPGHHGRAGPRP